MAGSNRYQLASSNVALAAVNVDIPGQYGFYGEAASWGTLQLQFQSPQGTWINIGTALSTNGLNALQLPAGQYRVVVSGTSAAFAALITIPTITTR